ncbi:benenodin family lasso peptide [Luteimonas sp. FCS-9]|nr:benenodin family lasso peptide [Luteimonas sp. FCS-9]
MNTNDNTRTEVQDDVIELGVASVETQGGAFDPGEVMGLNITPGISEE